MNLKQSTFIFDATNELASNARAAMLLTTFHCRPIVEHISKQINCICHGEVLDGEGSWVTGVQPDRANGLTTDTPGNPPWPRRGGFFLLRLIGSSWSFALAADFFSSHLATKSLPHRLGVWRGKWVEGRGGTQPPVRCGISSITN